MRQLIFLIMFIGFTSCGLLPAPKSEQVTVVLPVSKPSNFVTNDSSFLKLTIKEKQFQVEFLDKVRSIDNIENLDSFFQKNATLINKEKIVITGFDTANANLIRLLKKYGISKFHINTVENQ